MASDASLAYERPRGVVIGPAGEVNGVCASVPSATTVHRILCGDMTALPLLLRDFAGRMVFTGTGSYLMGLRGKNLLRASFGSALGIEVAVFLHAIWLRNQAARIAAQTSAPTASTQQNPQQP